MSESLHPIGEPQELAALYLCGSMTAAESAAFESHLAAGCRECNGQLASLDVVVSDLLRAVEPERPNPAIRQALLEAVEEEAAGPQVWRNWQADSEMSDLVVHQAATSGWESSGIDGIDFRRLSVDRLRNRMTALVRMAPGTSYPAHVHDGPEECLVLQGDLRAGRNVLHAGDYERRVPGSEHAIQRTENGCLLLIISSLTDELL